MQPPKVSTCLLCEDVRMEKGNKISIMGLYGALPKADLLVQDVKVPIQRLAFVIMMHGGDGEFDLSAKIERPQGRATYEFPAVSRAFSPGAKKGVAVINILGFIAEVVGEFRFRSVRESRKMFDSTFTIQIGEQKDFV